MKLEQVTAIIGDAVAEVQAAEVNEQYRRGAEDLGEAIIERLQLAADPTVQRCLEEMAP